ncbi:MAG: hypothetical protein NTY19_03365, partial [Planctomycetota bacterium]|nr:hypothetical protein [Planctomycetota bacterium]
MRASAASNSRRSGSRGSKRARLRRNSRSLRSRSLRFEQFEPRLLLSLVPWDGGPAGTGTNWSDPANWVGDVLPTAADDVQIGAAFASRTISSANNVTINQLTSEAALTISGGTFYAATTIQVNNTLTLSGGTLKHATVLPGSGGHRITFTSSGGTLDGVTVNGDLDLTGGGKANVGALVTGGLTLNGTASLGSDSTSGQLYFSGSQTLGGTGSVVFGSYFDGNYWTSTVPTGLYALDAGMTLT